jgi:RimJ/RimL family protein N-acetyltransferase
MKNNSIETQRLIIKALTSDELKMYVQSMTELARALDLRAIPDDPEPVVVEAITKDLLPNLNDSAKDAFFYTLWVVIEKAQRKIAAGFCFHGSPDEHGEIEIGYGTQADYQNQGIMSETLNGLIDWLQKNTSVKIIRAETENENLPSVKLLEKTGFIRCNDKDSLSVWRLALQQ